jgi:hypothetical protein
LTQTIESFSTRSDARSSFERIDERFDYVLPLIAYERLDQFGEGGDCGGLVEDERADSPELNQ